MQTLEQYADATYPKECSFSESDWMALSNLWYPIALEADIEAEPKKVTLLDVDLVLARLDGAILVARDLCIHRGAPMSMGWVRDGCLVCPYHGYRYDISGACTFVPSDPRGAINSKLRLLVFRSTVKYGLVWVCLRGEPSNMLPVWEPEATDPKFFRFTMGPEIWDCSAGRAIENFIDNAHFSFVHRNTFGLEENAEQGATYDFEVDDQKMIMAFEYQATNPEDSPIANANELHRYMHRTLFFPFATRTAIHYPGGRDHIIHINIAPVSARKSQLIVVFTRNFDHDVPVEDLLAWEQKILGEDRVMIENQKPEEIPLDAAAEISVMADKSSVAFRRWLTKLGLGRAFTA